MITVSDASWANDQKVVYTDMDVKIFPRKSQYGRLLYLGILTFGMQMNDMSISLASKWSH